MIMSEGKCICERVIISINIYEQCADGFDDDACTMTVESCAHNADSSAVTVIFPQITQSDIIDAAYLVC